jgi:hypothetical protein
VAKHRKPEKGHHSSSSMIAMPAIGKYHIIGYHSIIPNQSLSNNEGKKRLLSLSIKIFLIQKVQ